MSRAPQCPYCGATSERVTGAVIYPHRHDLNRKVFYRCEPCSAYVGCHPGGDRPLGRLANAELRRAKSAAHAVFDPLWKRKIERDGVRKHEARGAAYRWLAEQMQIHPDDCHIGMFDVAQCKRVVALCEPYGRRAA